MTLILLRNPKLGPIWWLAYYIPRLSRASLCVSWAFLFTDGLRWHRPSSESYAVNLRLALDAFVNYAAVLNTLSVIPLTHAQETYTSRLAQETCTSDMPSCECFRTSCTGFLHPIERSSISRNFVQERLGTYIKIWLKRQKHRTTGVIGLEFPG